MGKKKSSKNPEQIAEEEANFPARWWSLAFHIPSLREVKMKHIYAIRESILTQNATLPEDERLSDVFHEPGHPASVIFSPGRSLRITGVGREGCRAMTGPSADKLLSMIQVVHPDASVKAKVKSAPFTLEYSRQGQMYKYKIYNLAITKPQVGGYQIQNIQEYVHNLLVLDMKQTFAFTRPLKAHKVLELEVKIISMTRPSRVFVDDDSHFLVLAHIFFEANVKMFGPYHLGYETHVGYGRIESRAFEERRPNHDPAELAVAPCLAPTERSA